MDLNRKLNSLVLPVLLISCIVLLAWASTQNILIKDLTNNGRQSLTEPSKVLLERIRGSIEIDVFVNRSDQLGQQVEKLMTQYQQIKPDIMINYISPEENPDKVREYNIRFPAEMLIRYQGKTEHLEKPSEQTITNSIAALFRDDERWLVFLSGHGERAPVGNANFDLDKFVGHLKKRGLKSQLLNLSETTAIPDNTSVLIIADPKVNFLPEERMIIENYLEKGGNLLWLTEPDHRELLPELAENIGVTFLKGIIVDAEGQSFKITQPDLIPITKYPDHAITKSFSLTTLFPQAVALEINSLKNWNSFPLINSSEQSWTEFSEIKDQVDYDETKEKLGPLTIAMALTSQTNQQRILIVGDSDFISNSYIGNGGNLDLGVRMMNWLSADDQLITIPSRPATDLDFELSDTASAIIGLGFLIVLPLLLAIAGLVIWWRRRSL